MGIERTIFFLVGEIGLVVLKSPLVQSFSLGLRLECEFLSLVMVIVQLGPGHLGLLMLFLVGKTGLVVSQSPLRLAEAFSC